MSTHGSRIATALLGGILSLAAGAAALADDTEVFVNQAALRNVRPNILFIIDTSGSMSGNVQAPRAPYNPAITYGGECAAGDVYWRASGTGNVNPPDCDDPTRFSATANRCAAATTGLAGIAGSWTGDVARFDPDAALWKRLSGDAPDDVVECRADSGAHGSDGSSSLRYAQNGDASAPWSANPSREIDWGGASTYTLYSANWLNWYNSPPVPTTTTRLQTVQAVATSLASSIDGVNLGLMRFSSNAEGGMVIHEVADIATSRASIISSINALTPEGATPLAETMYEAGQYFAGRAVDYGARSVVGGSPSRSVPASRDPQDASRYQSPIAYQCQRNFAILLTDGEPVDDTGANTLIPALPDYGRLVGSGCSAAANVNGACLPDMADYLHKADLSATLPGQQNVTTYTIGFGPEVAGSNLLDQTATRGGGEAYSADNVTNLTTTLQAIVGNILQTSSTFTAPSVSINAFNRTESLNDLYISVFSPEATAHWPGNLKKYEFRNGRIVDATGNDAVDPTTGFFRQGVQSIWSATADGANVAVGGAASRLPAETARRLYTLVDSGGNRNLTAVSNRFERANPTLTAASLGLASITSPTREQLIDWARGIDVQDEDADGDRTEMHRFMGDPLHARPALVTYGGTPASPDVQDSVVFVPTNDGFLHAVNARTGVELWSFIPPELLSRLPDLYRNAGVASRSYGLDGDVRVLKFDTNLDGIVDPSAGDRVWIYFGMRRGGHTYYALDVTDRDNPRLRWKIGPTELPGIGETWSAPTVARVRVNGATQNGEHLVLIFGGGYDGAQENGPYVADTVGHRLYMVDAASGALLWYAGGPGGAGSPDLALDRMRNSIPGRVTVIDTDGDGFADRMYAADLGGRVFRFDIFNGAGRDSLVTGGVFASLGAGDLATPTLVDNRRFYYTPDVALIQRRGADPYYNLAIGSGYRGHPLSTDTRDRFYSLRDKLPFAKLTQATYNAFTPITEGDLIDITSNPGVTPVPTQARGWTLDLRLNGALSGEKVLAEALTVNGVILFPSYQPTPPSEQDPCLPASGRNRVYALGVDSGGPVIDYNDDEALTADDLFTDLAQSGIAGEVSFAYESVAGTQGNGGDDGSGQGGGGGNGDLDELGRRALCVVGVEVLSKCVQPSGVVRTYWERPGVD
ncbi:MAG: pilus assembly protein [Steroidobacteraceae bacterium]